MLNATAYPPLDLTTLQTWWSQHSQASTPLAIKYQSQCDSTNAQLYRSTRQHNTLLVAEQQSHGKGQFERAWVSQAGDLIFSLGLLLPSTALPALSLRVGLALRQVFALQNLDIQLTWANDLIATHPDTAQRGKLAGILVQTLPVTSDHAWVVIGIGVNVAARWLPFNATQSALPPIGLAQLSETWISPKVGVRDALLMQLVDTVLVHIETATLQNDLPSTWNEYDLWRDTPVTLTDPKGIEHHGIGAGINANGEYQIDSAGQVLSFHSGQLRARQDSR